MPLPPVLSSIVDWLRAGYPDGVPPQDFPPLLALLSRRLTHDEVAAVAADLASRPGGPVGPDDIGVLITKITDELPRPEDVDRVQAHLSAAGPFL